jgi:hypothetical protein
MPHHSNPGRADTDGQVGRSAEQRTGPTEHLGDPALVGCPAPDRLEDLPQRERGQSDNRDPQQRFAIDSLGERGKCGVLRIVAAPGPGDPHRDPGDQQVHDAVGHQADAHHDVEPGALMYLPPAPAGGVAQSWPHCRFGPGRGLVEFAHHAPCGLVGPVPVIMATPDRPGAESRPGTGHHVRHGWIFEPVAVGAFRDKLPVVGG